jgi:bla regulator protein blaR1
MTFGMRLVVMALAAFAAGGFVGALATWIVSRRRPRVMSEERTAFVLRLLPVIAATVAASLTVLSFVLFEQRGGETTGISLPILAILTVGLFVGAAIRAWRLHHRTSRVVGSWLATAEVVTLPGARTRILAISSNFPIVAVVGLVRQRMIIARSVLDACSPDELRAILAHEQAHLDRHDNLRRAILTMAPDILSWLPISSRMLEAWHDACEGAADDASRRLGEHGRVLLAQALIRVARLASMSTSPTVHDLPASALYRGEDLDVRIRRLLAPPSPPAAGRTTSHYFAMLAVVGAMLGLGLIQDVLEAAVTFLP